MTTSASITATRPVLEPVNQMITNSATISTRSRRPFVVCRVIASQLIAISGMAQRNASSFGVQGGIPPLSRPPAALSDRAPLKADTIANASITVTSERITVSCSTVRNMRNTVMASIAIRATKTIDANVDPDDQPPKNDAVSSRPSNQLDRVPSGNRLPQASSDADRIRPTRLSTPLSSTTMSIDPVKYAL